MNVSGLNALDPRVAATEKFISDKKIPPEQVPQFLMSMGADPRLAGLVMRFQRLKSASAQGGGQAQKPQTTVAQDVEAQQRGIAAPMAPMQGRDQGIAALPAPVMDRAKFADGGIVAFQEGGNEGLGDIDFTKMTNEQLDALTKDPDVNLARAAMKVRLQRSGYRTPGELASSVTEPLASGLDTARQSLGMGRYAAGNVPTPVAAAAPVEAPSAAAKTGRDWANAKQQNRKTREGTKPIPFFTLAGTEGDTGVQRPAGIGAGTGAGQINEGIKILRDQVKELKNMKPEDREARYRAAGIEDMTPKQLAKIEERISKLSGDKKRDAYMALAQAGFKMAAAASRPGATVLGAFGEGASEGAKMMADINKEYRTLQNDLEDKVLAIQRYQQERKEGKIDKDIEQEQKLASDLREAQRNLATFTENTRQFDVSTGLQRQQLAQQAQASKRGEDPIRDLKRRYIYAKTPQDQEQALKLLSELTQLDTRILVEQLKAEARLEQEKAKNPLYGGGIGGGMSDEGWGDVRVK